MTEPIRRERRPRYCKTPQLTVEQMIDLGAPACVPQYRRGRRAMPTQRLTTIYLCRLPLKVAPKLATALKEAWFDDAEVTIAARHCEPSYICIEFPADSVLLEPAVALIARIATFFVPRFEVWLPDQERAAQLQQSTQEGAHAGHHS